MTVTPFGTEETFGIMNGGFFPSLWAREAKPLQRSLKMAGSHSTNKAALQKTTFVDNKHFTFVDEEVGYVIGCSYSRWGMRNA